MIQHLNHGCPVIHCFKWFLYFHSEPLNRFRVFTLTRLLEKQVQSRHRQYFAVQSNFDLVVSRHDLHSITHSKSGQSGFNHSGFESLVI